MAGFAGTDDFDRRAARYLHNLVGAARQMQDWRWRQRFERCAPALARHLRLAASTVCVWIAHVPQPVMVTRDARDTWQLGPHRHLPIGVLTDVTLSTDTTTDTAVRAAQAAADARPFAFVVDEPDWVAFCVALVRACGAGAVHLQVGMAAELTAASRPSCTPTNGLVARHMQHEDAFGIWQPVWAAAAFVGSHHALAALARDAYRLPDADALLAASQRRIAWPREWGPLLAWLVVQVAPVLYKVAPHPACVPVAAGKMTPVYVQPHDALYMRLVLSLTHAGRDMLYIIRLLHPKVNVDDV
jgi:hypothetical protein